MYAHENKQKYMCILLKTTTTTKNKQTTHHDLHFKPKKKRKVFIYNTREDQEEYNVFTFSLVSQRIYTLDELLKMLQFTLFHS